MEFRAPSPLLLPSAEYIILKHRNSAKLPWHHNSKLCFWSLSFSLLTKDSFVQGITPVRCLPNSQIGSDPPQGQGWAGIPVPDHSREYRSPVPKRPLFYDKSKILPVFLAPFPFSIIPGNNNISFSFPKVGNGIFHSRSLKLQFPFQKVGTGPSHCCSRSQKSFLHKGRYWAARAAKKLCSQSNCIFLDCKLQLVDRQLTLVK